MFAIQMFYGHTRQSADYVFCECCERTLNADSDVVNIWGQVMLCNDCARTRIPEPGERVTVTREDSQWFGYSFLVDALMNGEVLLAVGQSFKLFKLNDIVRNVNGKKRRK